MMLFDAVEIRAIIPNDELESMHRKRVFVDMYWYIKYELNCLCSISMPVSKQEVNMMNTNDEKELLVVNHELESKIIEGIFLFCTFDIDFTFCKFTKDFSSSTDDDVGYNT